MNEKKEEVNLEKALDDSLDILEKAAAGEETLSKSASAEEEGNKGSEDESEEMHGDHKKGYMKGDKKEEEEEGVKGDEDEDDDEEDEDAKKKGFKKSAEDDLTKSETVKNAVEVSKFLKEFIKSQADMNGALVYRMKRLEKSNRALSGALAKSVGAQNDMLKSFGGSLESIGRKPMPRKAVDNATVDSLKKGFRNNPSEGGADTVAEGGITDLSKSQVAESMADLEIAGKIAPGSTSKFEMTGEITKSVESQVISAA